MSAQTHTVTVSDSLYQQLHRQAQKTQRSIEDLVEQTLQRHLPPSLENDLPIEIQAELKALEDLSDDALWQIADSKMNPDKVAMYDALLERQKAGTLTPEGLAWLKKLRQEAEALMLRKARAYVLLKNRGHQLPTLEELKQQASH
jgi:hypothetical protein